MARPISTGKTTLSPKKSLAKRLEAIKANSKRARKAISLADRQIYDAEIELEEALSVADAAWSGSIQAMLLEQFTGTCTQDNFNFVNKWLFDNRIMAAKDRQGTWNSFGSCWKAAYSYMASTMIKDKLLAADLAAEAETYELPEEAFSYLASCYDNNVEALFVAYDCPIDNPGFYQYSKETDELYGTKLIDHMLSYTKGLLDSERLAEEEAATETG
jgi:hypothetical protein